MSAQGGFSTATEPRASGGVPWLAIARGLLGMAVGGALGTVLFHFALRNGFYAIVLPGALAGIFCSGFMDRRYVPMGIVCALFCAALTLGIEWKYFPFRKDG